jgi:tetratricopeptide (TPR) repeat protein
MHEMLHLAQELGHPLSLVLALCWAAWLHRERGEGRVAQEYADAVVALSSEHGFPYYVAWGTVQQGGALIAQEHWTEGIVGVRQGLETQEGEIIRTAYLAWLAVGYRRAGQIDEGLAAVAEALRLVEKNDERLYEAELYRIKGTLTLQSQVESPKSQVEEAEACFLRAIEIAQKQQAKSLELRAVMSLARLWQQQGRKEEAHRMLAEIYGWFTEGFDTKDSREAKALLEELA